MKTKRKRITKVRAIDMLAKEYKISYTHAFKLYSRALKHCKIFKNDTVLGHIEYLIRKSEEAVVVNPFKTNAK